jgi:hypothetical protein
MNKLRKKSIRPPVRIILPPNKVVKSKKKYNRKSDLPGWYEQAKEDWHNEHAHSENIRDETEET